MPPSSGLALRIVSGPTAGTVVSLAEGSTVVGRASECSVVVPDPSLSRRHFELLLQGDTCWVFDLESRNGVLVNGAGILRKRVRVGDEIVAGDVIFRVEEERSGPLAVYTDVAPTLDNTAPPPPAGTLLANLRSRLRQDPASRVYALVDGAQAHELALMGRLMGHQLYTLFSGTLARMSAHVGPLLVQFDEPSGFLQKWTEQIGRNSGVLFETGADLESLYDHLRHVFIAIDEDRNEYFFRFYDPRVFRAFLPTCREEELREFFGPISAWIVEADGAPEYAAYTLGPSGVERHVIAGTAAVAAT
jgi:uncharacterized protein DUF4123/type III secretion system (T3SS) inner membrane Yop/YscD-like protein